MKEHMNEKISWNYANIVSSIMCFSVVSASNVVNVRKNVINKSIIIK